LDVCGSPAWTQDGRRILFDAQPSNHLEKTRLKAIDPVGERWAIRDLGPGNCPTPSPDGDRVIFLQNPHQIPDAETGIWIMGSDGNDRRHLGGYGRPKWSADVHQFLVISFASPCEVTLIDDRPAKKSGIVKISGHQIYGIPSWAGEQTMVAVLGDGAGTAGDTIALVDLSNMYRPEVKQVLWKKGDGSGPSPGEVAWSHLDGQCIFVGSDPRGMALYAVDASMPGMPPRRLEREGLDKLVRDLAFSPDGRYLLFSSSRDLRPQT
jgi:Tol biopolymer transport system component